MDGRRQPELTPGVGGKLAAGGEDEGKWTTVLSRRARRQERARLEGTSSGAVRKAAAARAAATWRTAAAVIDRVLWHRVSGRGGGRGATGESRTDARIAH